ncbi:hypothetical protein HD806DRAFT_395524 [Xylariaceae sp. AK1471]|nr:hypothetical protein HD806DRAFT_395524 [Xylariaceae sp. AK1471]
MPPHHGSYQSKAKRSEKPLISWTRFYLPRDQEWPTWSVHHDDVYVGPLKGVEGWRTASLGRMVDNPGQAAYIIQWVDLDAVKNFESSVRICCPNASHYRLKPSAFSKL